jgi:SAM-dependent methyltransferase
MAQNIYDTPEFFAGYSQLERSAHGLEGAAEWPSIRALLPDLRGKAVLDLGCGFGWFCRWAREHGAAQVLGLDVSENMLAKAREMTADPAIRYQRADLEQVVLPAASFDLAYSSLALHYIESLAGLMEQVRDALLPEGRFVFSVEHPIFTASDRPEWIELGGCRYWLLNNYLLEERRTTDWLAPGVIKQHRMIGTYLMLLIRLGFRIRHIEEWSPSEQQVAARPEWAEFRERPMFLLVSAQRSPLGKA